MTEAASNETPARRGSKRLVVGLGALVAVVVAGLATLHLHRQREAGARENALQEAFRHLNAPSPDPASLPATIRSIEDVLREHPDDPNALFALGWALQLANEPIKAETRYREACLLAEREQRYELQYYCRFNLGTLLDDQGQRAVAAAEFREAAAQADRADVRERGWAAWFRLGRALVGLQRYDDGLAALDEAARRSPSSGVVYLEKGRALMLAGDPRLARAALDEAVRLTPSLAAEVTRILAQTPGDRENRR